MKKLLIILLALLGLTVNAQTKKSVSKPTTLSKVILSEEDIVKSKAEDWFKTIYVESVFKDPYSYKLLKTIVIPKTKKEGLTDSLTKLQYTIDTTKLTPKDISDRAEYQSMYDKGKADLDKYSKLLETEKDPKQIEYYQKRNAINQKYALLCLSTLRQIDIYNVKVKQKEILEKIINTLTPEEANKLSYYEIRIDCYSNNSLGNQVLGRFSFPLNRNGTAIGPNGINNVIQTNKE